jgi:hypothetical protein
MSKPHYTYSTYVCEVFFVGGTENCLIFWYKNKEYHFTISIGCLFKPYSILFSWVSLGTAEAGFGFTWLKRYCDEKFKG